MRKYTTPGAFGFVVYGITLPILRTGDNKPYTEAFKNSLISALFDASFTGFITYLNIL